jgi:cytochrome c-type biogenesis protein CcmF
MFMGFVSSAGYDTKETVSLEQGTPVKVLNGFQLTYIGSRPIDNERSGFLVDVEHGNERFTVMPVMRYSNYTQSVLRNPDVKNLYLKDFYIAPMSLETPEDHPAETLNLLKGESKELKGLRVTFVDYDFNNTDKAKMMEGGGFSIGAVLEVSSGNQTEKIQPLMKNDGRGPTFIPAKPSFANVEFTISKLKPNREDPSQSRVELSYRDLSASGLQSKAETLVVEASIKPFINLVWAGTITLLLGFIVTIVRRVQEAKLKVSTD